MMFYLVVCSDGQNTGEGQSYSFLQKIPTAKIQMRMTWAGLFASFFRFTSRVRIQEGFREIIPYSQCTPQSTHRVATAAFWRTWPSWWKNLPRLVRVGGACHPFHCIYHHVQNCTVYAPAERADTRPPISYLKLCTLWCTLYTVHQLALFVNTNSRWGSRNAPRGAYLT